MKLRLVVGLLLFFGKTHTPLLSGRYSIYRKRAAPAKQFAMIVTGHTLIRLLTGITLAEVDCGDADTQAAKTFTLTSTDDVTTLASACPTVLASISISADAGGDISLDGIETISGSLSLENCEPVSCRQQTVTRISTSTLRLVAGDLVISGLDSLINVSFPLLGEVRGNIEIQDLAELDTLDLSAVTGLGGNFSLSEVEQLYYLDLSFLQAQNVLISGNGALVVQLGKNLDATNGQAKNQIQRLDISGVGEVRWGESVSHITLTDFSIHDSKITELPLVFSSIQNLEVLNNDKLTEILFPAEAATITELVSRLRQIAIRDNEKFNMTTIHSSTWNGTDMLSWVWPTEDMSSVELEGIIHNTFL